MTQEDKQLLLKDLCARLPYEPKLCIDGGVCSLLNIDKEEGDSLNGETFYTIGFKNQDGLYNFCALSEARPYLRPMSSMTEEEYNSISWEGCNRTINYSMKNGFQFIEITSFTIEILNWLNAHHFDYRGLIEKGLALEAPVDIYKTE